MTKEERREYLRKYRAKPINRERNKKAQKKYRLNNPEKIREQKKLWVERNKEKSKTSSKEWYENDSCKPRVVRGDRLLLPRGSASGGGNKARRFGDI